MTHPISHSKIQNVYGELTKKAYIGIQVNNKSVEGAGLSVSASYIAFPWDGLAGVVSVVSLKDDGTAAPDIIHFSGHRGTIQDFCFSPFYDSLLASASDDTTIRLWDVPTIIHSSAKRRDPVSTLKGHERRVSLCCFNPIADSVLASGSQDCTVRVWDVEKEKHHFLFKLSTALNHLKWNYNGALVAVASKDKMMSIIDPRNHRVVASIQPHVGCKATKLEWMGGGTSSEHLIFTSGFDKGSGREFCLWDTRALKESVQRGGLPKGISPLFPYYDHDSGLFMMFGRGDLSVGLLEYLNGVIVFRRETGTFDACNGFAIAPKRIVDVMKPEINRCYVINSKKSIQPMSLIVPRREQKFYSDLFPPCFSGEPSQTLTQWLNCEPVTEHKQWNMNPQLNVLCAHEHYEPRLSNSSAILQKHLSRAETQLSQLGRTSPSKTRTPSNDTKELEELKQRLTQLTEQLNSANKTINHLRDVNEMLTQQDSQLTQLFQKCKETVDIVYGTTANIILHPPDE